MKKGFRLAVSVLAGTIFLSVGNVQAYSILDEVKDKQANGGTLTAVDEAVLEFGNGLEGVLVNMFKDALNGSSTTPTKVCSKIGAVKKNKLLWINDKYEYKDVLVYDFNREYKYLDRNALQKQNKNYEYDSPYLGMPVPQEKFYNNYNDDSFSIAYPHIRAGVNRSQLSKISIGSIEQISSKLFTINEEYRKSLNKNIQGTIMYVLDTMLNDIVEYHIYENSIVAMFNGYEMKIAFDVKTSTIQDVTLSFVMETEDAARYYKDIERNNKTFIDEERNRDYYKIGTYEENKFKYTIALNQFDTGTYNIGTYQKSYDKINITIHNPKKN